MYSGVMELDYSTDDRDLGALITLADKPDDPFTIVILDPDDKGFTWTFSLAQLIDHEMEGHFAWGAAVPNIDDCDLPRLQKMVDEMRNQANRLEEFIGTRKAQ